MTQRLPSRPRKVAIAIPAKTNQSRRRLAYAIGILAFLSIFFLFANGLFAQEEISEEEAATEKEQSAEIEFDFFGGEAPVNIEQLREMQDHFAELSQDVADATVSVQVGNNQGTGVIVTRDGYIMTAAHVISGANLPARITLPNGDKLEATTLGLNRTVDSGLLKINDKGKYPYLNPGVSTDLKNGQWVMAIGHPGGWNEDRGLVFRIGRILRKSDTAISTDCSLVGGDSGGPLVDMNGDLIGIHSRIGMQLTDNIHVPVDQFSEQWDDLSSGRDWGRGIGGTNPANEPWMGFNLKGDRSLEIDSVVPNGPADKATLQEGDELVEMNGDRLRNRIRFGRLMRSLDPGDEIKFKIKRGDEELEIELKVGSRADRTR